MNVKQILGLIRLLKITSNPKICKMKNYVKIKNYVKLLEGIIGNYILSNTQQKGQSINH